MPGHAHIHPHKSDWADEEEPTTYLDDSGLKNRNRAIVASVKGFVMELDAFFDAHISPSPTETETRMEEMEASVKEDEEEPVVH